jgi:hypothetical protein
MKTVENKPYSPDVNVIEQTDKESDISVDERRRLDDMDNNSGEDDDERLTRASMDNTDEDGEALNEKGFGEDYSGGDLDIPRYSNDGYDDDDQLGEDDDNDDDDDY